LLVELDIFGFSEYSFITMDGEATQKPNLAFVDGQNMYLGTTKCHGCSDKLKIRLEDIKLSDCKCGTAWDVNLLKFKGLFEGKL
jgi:hypothetical protein